MNKLCLNFTVTALLLLPWRLKRQKHKDNELFKPPTTCLFPNLLSHDPSGWSCYPLKGPDLKVRNQWSTVVLLSTSLPTDKERASPEESSKHTWPPAALHTDRQNSVKLLRCSYSYYCCYPIPKRDEVSEWENKKKILKRILNMRSSKRCKKPQKHFWSDG